jgi:hypothetical protein
MEMFFRDICTYACSLADTIKGLQLLEDLLDGIPAWGLAFHHAHHLQCHVLQVIALMVKLNNFSSPCIGYLFKNPIYDF